MSGYIDDALYHAERIEYYYQNAGSSGYAQALYHWNKLVSLIFSARNSKRYKGEESIINVIRLEKQKMMDEMKLKMKDV